MKLIQVMNALPVLQKVMKLSLPIKKSFKIYTLAKQVNDTRDFFIKEEKKIIDKYEVKVLENGSLEFKDIEAQRGFTKEHNELLDYELEGSTAIDLTFDDLKDAKLSAIEVATLEGIINFID